MSSLASVPAPIFPVLVLILWACAAPSARAQPADTTRTTFVQSLKPAYSTVYDVDRQVTLWTQNFTFGSKAGFMSFNNKTKYNVRTDDGREETRKDGSNELSMRWLMIPKLPISTEVLLGRVSVVRPNDERETDNVTLNLNTLYNWNWGNLRHSVTGGGGYTRKGDLSIRNDSKSRSTDAGWSGNGSWRGTWRATNALTATGNYRFSRSDKISKLQEGDGPVTNRPTKNSNRSYGLSFKFDPASWVTADATYSDVSGNDEFFIVQGGAGALEKKINAQRTLTGALVLNPMQNLDLNFNVRANQHTLGYRVRQDIASKGDGLSWDGSVKTRIAGTDIEGKLSRSLDNLNPATSADTENRTSIFDGKLVRPLMPQRLTFQFDWLVRATQLFFLDPDPEFEPLDRDELRTKLQPTLRYTPGDRWQVNASYIRSTSRRVEQNATRASQTRNDEDFTVDISVGFDLSDRTNIQQIYSIKALYTTFDYNPGADRLLRTQRILTNLGSQITRRVFLMFEHRFTRQDSGPFRVESGEGRIFARDQRTYNQELTTDLRYTLFSWLTLNFFSRFQRTDDVEEATQRRSTLRNLEIREGLEVNQSVGQGLRFSARATYTRSNVRDSFWKIVSTLDKQF